MSTDAAPITIAGVVLSQPASSTTPSTGLPRIDSSTSMAIRLRSSMVVGWICASPSEITGNSSGTPPESQTPRLTNSASSWRCWLHGARSDAELQMPIIGLPLERVVGQAALHPAPVDVVVTAAAVVPTCRPQRDWDLVILDLVPLHSLSTTNSGTVASAGGAVVRRGEWLSGES